MRRKEQRLTHREGGTVGTGGLPDLNTRSSPSAAKCRSVDKYRGEPAELQQPESLGSDIRVKWSAVLLDAQLQKGGQIIWDTMENCIQFSKNQMRNKSQNRDLEWQYWAGILWKARASWLCTVYFGENTVDKTERFQNQKLHFSNLRMHCHLVT